MACMWAELIDNNLLSDPNASVNVHDILNIIQRAIVLLGTTNEMLSQLRHSKILTAVAVTHLLSSMGRNLSQRVGSFCLAQSSLST